MPFARGAARLCCCLALLAALSCQARRLADDGTSTAAAATTLPASALAGLGSSSSGSAQQDAPGTVEMRIINGEVVNSTDFNFMAALFRGGRFFCGGVLLGNDSVLTAAHCVVDTGLVNDPSALTVWLLGNTYTVDAIFAHPGYSPSTIPNDNKDLNFSGPLHDLALVKLAEPAASDAPRVSLVPQNTSVEPGQGLQVAGWGTTESGQPSTALRYATVDYLPAANCPADYDDVLCAGGTGENTCNGDSGGPLLIRNDTTREALVLGVTSHGPDCLAGPTYAYGFYTDVRLYMDAIASWQAGQNITWPPPAANGTNGTANGVLSGQLPPDFIPDPVTWTPVPGWTAGQGWPPAEAPEEEPGGSPEAAPAEAPLAGGTPSPPEDRR